MFQIKSNYHIFLLLLLSCQLILLVQLRIAKVECTRVRLYLEDEPTSDQVYNTYRLAFSDMSSFHLKKAKVIEVDHRYLEDKLDSNGQFEKANLNFNSSEYIRKAGVVKWFVPLDERTALHIYDDPKEQELASGQQVDQEMCGLHLDYMLYLIENYARNIANTTELSIFTTMSSYDSPRLGIIGGNNIWVGDYNTCIWNKLNVVRSELNKIDEKKAEKFFKSKMSEARQQLEDDERLVKKSMRWIQRYLGPFVGFVTDEENELYIKNADKLHMLSMRYCLARIRYPEWVNSSHYVRNFVLNSAACLPETCDSSSLRFHGDKIKQLINFWMAEYQSGFYISSLYCLPDEKSSFRSPTGYMTTVAFIIFIFIWFSLVIVATYTKHKKLDKENNIKQHTDQKDGQKISSDQYLDCWCLIRNFGDLFQGKRIKEVEKIQIKPSYQASSLSENTQTSNNQVNLDPLEGFKVLSSLSVITSHAAMVIVAASWNPNYGHYFMSKSWIASISTICPSVVDNFFVVTGIISAYFLLQTPRKTLFTVGFWLKFFVYRYIRIVPLYLLVHWFLQSAFRFIGSGPFWDYGTSFTGWSKMCQDESWWSVLMLQASFKSPAAHCNGVGWYLANDLQCSLLTPLIILIYLKKPILGHLTVALGAMTAMTLHVRYYLNLDKDTRGALEGSMMILTRVTDDATDGYVNPQYRCIAYLIGLSAGLVLHSYEKGSIRRWPKSFVSYGKLYVYIFLYLLIFLPFLTTLLPMDNQDLIHILGSILGGTIHGATSIAMAILLLLLCTNQMPYASYLLSFEFFRPLANASLSTLVVHIPLIFYHTQSMTSLSELTPYSSWRIDIMWILESFILSLVVHVLFEVPLRRFLIKLILRLVEGKQKTSRSSIKEKKV